MKIGLVCPYNIHKHGGVQEVVWALKKGLQERGHEVKIITPQPRNHEDEVDDPDMIYAGVSVDFRTLSFSDTTSQVSSTGDADHIDEIMATENFDVLHFHEPWMPLLSRQLLQRSNTVNIATFHSKVTTATLSRSILKVVSPYLKSVMKYLHVLTAVSDSAAEYAIDMTHQPITIIPNGIDLAKYNHKPVIKKPEAEKTILFVGRLERRKGVKYLLQAFQLLQQNNSNVRLQIAGDGPDREKLELLAEDMKVKNVDFLGFVSEDLKVKLLAEADIFCSPALFGESFGIVLLEAMATNTVTVAGNNSGYKDVMQGLGALSIVNPKDTEEFASRLQLLLNEPELQKLWHEWAAEYVQQFSYEKVVEQYEELYREALEQHGRKA